MARALLRRDPLSENAHQRVMRLHYLQGDRAAALAAFDARERLLKDEVGTPPSPATLALLATIEQAGGALAVESPRSARTVPVAVQRPPGLVGRARELQALEQAWSGAQVAAVVGEAGIGKSRLPAEFMAGERGVVRAAGRPGDADVLVHLANTLYLYGRSQEALPHLEEAARIGSRHEVRPVNAQRGPGTPRGAVAGTGAGRTA